MTARFFEWLPFVVLACWGLLGLTRASLFRARGQAVVVVDRQRTVWQMMADSLAAVCLLVWSYEIVAHAWDFRLHVGPTILRRILVDSVAIKIVGAGAMSVALVLYASALCSLGESWRLGIDRAAPGPLVTGGVYRWSRHPIYVAFDLLFVGAFLVLGRLIFLVLAVLWIPLLHTFMRREERFLAQRFGDAYRDYCGRVGRYFSRPRRDRERKAT